MLFKLSSEIDELFIVEYESLKDIMNKRDLTCVMMQDRGKLWKYFALSVWVRV